MHNIGADVSIINRAISSMASYSTEGRKIEWKISLR